VDARQHSSSDVGTKCKFSHDRNVERKVDKLNIYEDARTKEADKKTGRLYDTSGCGRVTDNLPRFDGELGRGETADGCQSERAEAIECHGRELQNRQACVR
jgi:hypothetical protein